MTCNCVDKLAAAIRADKAKYPHADGAMLLSRIADALSPPPSAPVPELAGWRADVKIESHYEGGWYLRIRWDWWWRDGKWVESDGLGCTRFPTRAAAEAALNAASEPPGVVEDKPKPKTTDEPCPTCTDKNAQWGLGAIDHPESRMAGGRPWSECADCNGTGYVLKNPREAWSFVEETPAPTTGTTNTRPYAAVVADGKAVPAAGFDAEKPYRASGPWIHGPGLGSGIYGGGDVEARTWALNLNTAHAAGAASAKPRRFSSELPRPGERIFAYDPRGWYFSGPFKNIPQDATHWHPDSILPPPADAKEGT